MNDRVAILHLEDNPRDAELVRHLLQQTAMTCDLRLARNRAEYEAALAETQFDLILSDYGLPDHDADLPTSIAKLNELINALRRSRAACSGRC